MKFCSNCGAAWTEAGSFCGNCGVPASVGAEGGTAASSGERAVGAVGSAPATPVATSSTSAGADALDEPPHDATGSGGDPQYEYEYVLVEAPSQVDLRGLAVRLRAFVPVSGQAGSVAAVSAIVLVLATFASILGVLLVALVDDGDLGVPVDWIRAGVYVLIAALGGVVSTRSGDAGTDSTAEVVHYFLAPLILTLFFAAVFYGGFRRFVGPRLAGRGWRQAVGTLALATAVIWLGLLFLAVASRGQLSWSPVVGRPTFVALSWQGFAFSAVIIWLTGAAALMPNVSDLKLPTQGSRARAVEAAGFAVSLLICSVATCAVVVLLVKLVTDDGFDGSVFGFSPTGLADWVLVPNVAVVLAGMLHGATMSSTNYWNDVAMENGLLAGDSPAWAYAAAGLLLLVGLGVGVRHALRRPVWASAWSFVWVAPAVYAALWGFLALLTVTRVERGVTGDLADGSVTAAEGLGPIAATLCALVWAFVALLGGRLSARWAAGWFPLTVARLAGRRMNSGWARLLRDRLERDRRRIPGYLAARASSPEDSETVRIGRSLSSGHGTATVAVLSLVTAATLLFTPMANSSFCGMPYAAQFMAEQQQPSAVPPPEVQDELDQLTAAADEAATDLKSAEEAAGPGATRQEAHQAAEAELSSANQEVTDLRAAVTQAQAKVSRLSNVGEWERDWLDQARQDYEDLKAYDDDGFWLDQVHEAEDDLYKAEAPLRRAQAALDDTRQQLSDAEARLAEAQGAELQTAEAFAPYEAKLTALTNATANAGSTQYELKRARDVWSSQLSTARAEVLAYNQGVALCHSDARPRTIPAAVLLLGVLALGPLWLLRRRRRRVPARHNAPV